MGGTTHSASSGSETNSNLERKTTWGGALQLTEREQMRNDHAAFESRSVKNTEEVLVLCLVCGHVDRQVLDAHCQHSQACNQSRRAADNNVALVQRSANKLEGGTVT